MDAFRCLLGIQKKTRKLCAIEAFAYVWNRVKRLFSFVFFFLRLFFTYLFYPRLPNTVTTGKIICLQRIGCVLFSSLSTDFMDHWISLCVWVHFIKSKHLNRYRNLGIILPNKNEKKIHKNISSAVAKRSSNNNETSISQHHRQHRILCCAFFCGFYIQCTVSMKLSERNCICNTQNPKEQQKRRQQRITYTQYNRTQTARDTNQQRYVQNAPTTHTIPQSTTVQVRDREREELIDENQKQNSTNTISTTFLALEKR